MLRSLQFSFLVLDHKGGHVQHSQAPVVGVIFGLPARDQAEPTVSHVHPFRTSPTAYVNPILYNPIYITI